MGYALHIEREEDITLEEWCAAVESIEGVRLANADLVQQSPNTGEEIRLAGALGDVEVLCESKGFLGFGAKAEWVRAFTFSSGSATFGASDSIESPSNPIHIAAATLAIKLGAAIVGDEGEEYEW